MERGSKRIFLVAAEGSEGERFVLYGQLGGALSPVGVGDGEAARVVLDGPALLELLERGVAVRLVAHPHGGAASWGDVQGDRVLPLAAYRDFGDPDAPSEPQFGFVGAPVPDADWAAGEPVRARLLLN